MLEAAFPGASSVRRAATLGAGGRCRSRLVAASRRAAHDTVEPVRQRRGGHRGRGMGRATGDLSCVQCATEFFGCFQPSVAQASSEGWFGRFLDRRVPILGWTPQPVYLYSTLGGIPYHGTRPAGTRAPRQKLVSGCRELFTAGGIVTRRTAHRCSSPSPVRTAAPPISTMPATSEESGHTATDAQLQSDRPEAPSPQVHDGTSNDRSFPTVRDFTFVAGGVFMTPGAHMRGVGVAGGPFYFPSTAHMVGYPRVPRDSNLAEATTSAVPRSGP